MKKIILIFIIILVGGVVVFKFVKNRGFVEPQKDTAMNFTGYCTKTKGIIETNILGIGAVDLDLQTLDTVQDLGVHWFRVDLPWVDIEHEETKFNWQGTDYLVKELQKRNLNLLAIISHPPDWVWSKDSDAAYRAAKRFGKEITARYKGKIRYWEIFNEPNLPGFGFFREGEKVNISKYVVYLSGMNTGIHASDPNAVIVLGGLSSSEENISLKNFLDGLYKEEGGRCFDVFAFHPYGFDGRFEEVKKELENQMKRYGDSGKPIWFNEYGTSDNNLRKDLLNILRDEIKVVPAFFWFSVKDFSLKDPYGLVTADFRKKEPDYSLFKALVESYQNPR
ncbi:MAG: cellulase family glycosylhydrolase [Candidatus Azambacteria bacterium]|nr:cellulase family glycosylhydrolase [Candidatus Azambacteria bacterium]